MPLTATGQKILREMMKTYHSAKKGKSVFYAMEREGKLTPKAFAGGRKKIRKAKRRKK